MNPRRCVACRKAYAAEKMSRLVRTPDGHILLDKEGRAPGRGAYLCQDPRCLALARKKGLLSKALGQEVPVELIDELAAQRKAVTDELGSTDSVLHLLGLARRGGGLVIGQDRVLEVIKTYDGLLALIASDCPDKIRAKIEMQDVPTLNLDVNRHQLGEALGLGSVVVCALDEEGGFANKARQLLEGRNKA